MSTQRDLIRDLEQQEQQLREGGREAGVARQRKLGRLTVRERIAELLDPGTPFRELGLWAAWGMYSEWGDVPAAGVVVGLGRISGRPCVVVANDATVKAGAMFPQSVKKFLRAQRIAARFRLPLVYLVDSSGVFLPLQDEIFPDEDDFGRIFRNNAVLSAEGIPQYAAVMGNCVAGGAYLPVLCDTVVMTEGSQLFLAGPALVKAAIGQEADPEELGGAEMHAAISGTVDFREPDDHAALVRLRRLLELLDDQRAEVTRSVSEGEPANGVDGRSPSLTRRVSNEPARDPNELLDLVPTDGRSEYDMRHVLECLVDRDSLQEFKPEYGQTIVAAFAKIGGHSVGIVANQRTRSKSRRGELEYGGVLYPDSAEKAARFVMDCNQSGLPLIFLQDVQGFMVGKQAEQSGIIRAGAKLVNVVSNSVVPKLTVILGGSFGAGNYALCGKAYDPWLILAWPSARYAVMGAAQAAETLLTLRVREAERTGRKLADTEIAELRDSIRKSYEQQTDIRYGAARGWVDAIISPVETRAWLKLALDVLPSQREKPPFRTGVWQV
ncbi:MAG: acyl-CoA carboxylase subunit beta [Planctomycetota bacterium]|nr:MAG: acyl-CoA carboxylase subunit beta [Planctomycetota bacterium]GDY09593.1 propionyl-CoA carboxylase subunit beta [Planctomycetia bacterium]